MGESPDLDRKKKDVGKEKGKTGKTGKDDRLNKKKPKEGSAPKAKESQPEPAVDKTRKGCVLSL